VPATAHHPEEPRRRAKRLRQLVGDPGRVVIGKDDVGTRVDVRLAHRGHDRPGRAILGGHPLGAGLDEHDLVAEARRMASELARDVRGGDDDESSRDRRRFEEDEDLSPLVPVAAALRRSGGGDLGGVSHRRLVELGTPQRSADLAARDDAHRVADRTGRRSDDLDRAHLHPRTPVLRSLVGRRPSRVPVTGRVLAGPTSEQLDGVGKHGHRGVESLSNALRAPGEVHDQRHATASGNGSRERGHRGLRQPGSAHELGETGCLAVDDRPGRLRRNIPRSEARAAGGDDEAHVDGIRELT
jgi:hypothetical protein